MAFLLSLPMTSAALTKRESQALFETAQTNPRQLIRESEHNLRYAQARMDPIDETKALLGLATAHHFLSDYDALAKDAEQGIEIARETGDRNALCRFLAYGGLGLYSKGSLDADAALKEAGKLFDEAAAIGEKHSMQACLGWVQLARGKIFNAVRLTSDSLAAASKAYTVFESEGDRFGMAAALTDIAAYTLIRNTEKDAEKIREYLDRASNLVDLDTYRLLAAEINLLHGHNEYFLQNLREARTRFEKATAISRGVQYHFLTGLAERELADIAKAEKRLAEAFRHVDLSLQMVENHPDKRHYIKAMLLRADVLFRLGRRAEGLEALRLSEAAQSRINDPSSTVLYYLRSAEIYADLDDFHDAYRQLEALRKVEARLNALRNQRLTDELKVRFDVALTESENARLVAERQEAESRRLALTLGLTLTVVLSAALIGGLVFYMRKRAADTRIEMEHQKRLVAAEAEANHAKSEFLANMSHELRSPLNAILGFSRLVTREPGLSDETRGNLQTVLRSGEHLYHLINQILDLSKIEAGRMTLNDTVFNLHLLLDELEQMFSLSARQKHLTMTVERAPDLPIHVRADAVKLRQILINLMSNALKFTAQGSVTLHVRRAGLHHLSMSVTDTGPGISADELKTLGNAFVQAGEGRRSREGTGLGLVICNRFVKLMGGELRMESEIGQGSRFSFEIGVTEIDNPGRYAQTQTASGRVIGLAPGQQRFRILAVDDLPDQRKLLRGLLGSLGFEVREAANGAEAIEVWEEWSPHLIWMDMRMPVLNGMEATRRIKATEKGKSTVIIALTASTFEDERDEILHAGCDDFLRKPFQEQALFAQLHQHLGVNFIYEQPREERVAEPVSAERVAALPAELREKLSAALAGLDVEAVNLAIDEVRMVDPEAADALALLAAGFDYGRMLALLPAPAAATE
jgi:signal transduction histidine kinase/FixJ family two-component response regulator